MATNVPSVDSASQRCEQHRLGGLINAPGPGRRRRIHPAIVRRSPVGPAKTPSGGTRGRSRTMARTTGRSHLIVDRTGRGKQLKPDRIKAFKPSQNANLEEGVWNVIDPYVDPSKRRSCSARVHRPRMDGHPPNPLPANCPRLAAAGRDRQARRTRCIPAGATTAGVAGTVGPARSPGGCPGLRGWPTSRR